MHLFLVAVICSRHHHLIRISSDRVLDEEVVVLLCQILSDSVRALSLLLLPVAQAGEGHRNKLQFKMVYRSPHFIYYSLIDSTQTT